MPLRDVSLQTVRRLVAGVVALALVAGGGWLAYQLYQEAHDPCDAEGVIAGEGPDGETECVGVTDGSFAFTDELKEVLGEIKKANDDAERSGDYVTVAYMTAFTLTKGRDNLTVKSVKQELQGAHLAQQRYNGRGTHPRLRLEIANMGSQFRNWKPTVDALIARRESRNLVAVTGLGQSTEESKKAVRRLAAKTKLAMVANSITSTEFRNTADGIEGLVRVAPTNVDEAWAAAEYLRDLDDVEDVVLVKDKNKKNSYARTLAASFTEALRSGDGPRLAEEDPKEFDSSARDAVVGVLEDLADNLCEHQPDAVYFAGRGQHLTSFLDALVSRPCQTWEPMVMTGDDTTTLSAEDLRGAAEKGVEVHYTGLTHPEMAEHLPEGQRPPGKTTELFTRDGTLNEMFGKQPRDDGDAMTAYDAVTTALEALKRAKRNDIRITGQSVREMLFQLDHHRRVPATSGFLSFRNNGDPKDRWVPILRLTGEGRPELVKVLPGPGSGQGG